MIKSWRIRQAGHVAHMVEKKCEHKDFVGNPERKKPLGRSRHRWNNIKMDFKNRMGGCRLNPALSRQ
jgi:hypothetical protein